MKSVILIVILAVLAAGAEKEKKDTTSRSRKSQTLTLPSDAKELEPGTWRHTDKEGTVWIYRKTPFGLARYPETKAEADDGKKNQNTSTLIKAYDEGDKVRFERHTPFGKQVWTRQKTELTEEETKALEITREGRPEEKTSGSKTQ